MTAVALVAFVVFNVPPQKQNKDEVYLSQPDLSVG